jgi:hypothetical protein
MAEATKTPPVAVPPEVVAFADEQGVADYLPSVLEMTARLFPSARRLAALVEADPEIAGERTLILEVDLPLDVREARDAHRRWNDALFACCPATLVCVFALRMELVP